MPDITLYLRGLLHPTYVIPIRVYPISSENNISGAIKIIVDKATAIPVTCKVHRKFAKLIKKYTFLVNHSKTLVFHLLKNRYSD